MDSIMFIFFGRVTDTIEGKMDEFANAFDAIQVIYNFRGLSY